MNRVKRMAPIMELAEIREKEAAQALGQIQQKLDETLKGLSSLNSFRENYSALFYQSGAKGLGIRQLHEYRAFLGKINTAIVEQEKIVHQAQVDLQKRKTAWKDSHRHTLAMKKIMDKLHAEELRMEQKREQREQDERASRRGCGAKTLSLILL